MPRKRKASDPEENFEVDEHGNLIKDYGASPDIPSLSVGGYKDPTVAAMERYYTPEIQQKVADFWGDTPQQLPLASPYTAQPTGMSFPGAINLQQRAEAEQTPMTQVVSPSTGFADQTVPAPPGADPNYQPGLLAALNRELGGAMSNVSDPAWLNRQIGGAMSGVGDAVNATSQGVLDFLSRTGEGIYNALPSRQTVKDFFEVLRDTGISATPQGALGLRELEMRRDINLQNIQRQQAQQQEQKRQHDLQVIEKIISSNFPSNVKGQLLEQSGIHQGQMLSKALKDADYQSFKSYMQYFPQEVQQKFMAGTLDPTEMGAWLDQARTQYKEDVKGSVQRQVYDRAVQTPAKQRTPSQQRAIEEYQRAQEESASKTDLQKAQAELARAKAAGGADEDKSFINKEAQALMNKPWAQLSQEEKKRVIDFDTQRQGDIAYLRSRGSQQAQLEIPDKPSTGERKEMAEDLATLGGIQELSSIYTRNKEFIGPARGRFGNVLEFFGATGFNESDLRARVATLRNSVIKQITGAQMSEPEAKRIMQQIPDVTNGVATFEARLHATLINTYRMALRKRDILAATGIEISNIPPLQLAVTRNERRQLVETWVREGVPRDEIKKRISGLSLTDNEESP